MPEIFVHITPDLTSDLEALYESKGQSADEIRAALIKAIRMLKEGKWDDSLVKQHGFSGTRFSFNFCSEFIFTFRIDTYRDDRKQPIQEHYFLKNLLRKK